MPIEDPVPNRTPLPPEPPALDWSGWTEVGHTFDPPAGQVGSLIAGIPVVHDPDLEPGTWRVQYESPLDVSRVLVSEEALARLREQTAEIIRRAGAATVAMAPAIQAATATFAQMSERAQASYRAMARDSGADLYQYARQQLGQYQRMLTAHTAQPGDTITAMIGLPSTGRITRADMERGLELAFSRPHGTPVPDPHDVSNIDEALRCFNWGGGVGQCRGEDQGLGWCSEQCHTVFLYQQYGTLSTRPENRPDLPVDAPFLGGDPHGPGGEASWQAPRDHPERETSRRPNWLEGESGVQSLVLAVDESHAFVPSPTEGQPGVEGPQLPHPFGNATMRGIVTRVADLIHARYVSVWVEFEYDLASNSLRCTARNGRREAMLTWPMEEIGGAVGLEESLCMAAHHLARLVQAGI